MKKILLMSAFVLFGSFVMANDTLNKTTETVVIEGSITVYTTIYGCNGEIIGKTTSSTDCTSCEGANIIVNKVTYCPDAESFPEPER